MRRPKAQLRLQNLAAVNTPSLQLVRDLAKFRREKSMKPFSR
jgi:hypothetical protein